MAKISRISDNTRLEALKVAIASLRSNWAIRKNSKPTELKFPVRRYSGRDDPMASFGEGRKEDSVRVSSGRHSHPLSLGVGRCVEGTCMEGDQCRESPFCAEQISFGIEYLSYFWAVLVLGIADNDIIGQCPGPGPEHGFSNTQRACAWYSAQHGSRIINPRESWQMSWRKKDLINLKISKELGISPGLLRQS